MTPRKPTLRSESRASLLALPSREEEIADRDNPWSVAESVRWSEVRAECGQSLRNEGTDRSGEPTMRSESRAGLPALPSREEERANGPNSVTGHKHIAQRYHLRVCDWSDSGRNSLAVLRALGRGVWSAAEHTSEEDQASSIRQGEALPRRLGS